MFPDEAGVNTNQSEWPSQGQFQHIVSTAEKNSKTAGIVQNKGGKHRLFSHLTHLCRFDGIRNTVRKLGDLRFVFTFHHYAD
ncbi:hypothetical protein D3C75_607410 [compost metagenome]